MPPARTIAAVRRDEFWHLRLYVAGQSPKSLHAFANLTSLCEEHLAGRYEIEVVDLVEHPAAGPQPTTSSPSRRWCAGSRRRCARSSATSRILTACWSASVCSRSKGHDRSVDATLERFEADSSRPTTPGYELTLFVSGASDLSARAIANATPPVRTPSERAATDLVGGRRARDPRRRAQRRDPGHPHAAQAPAAAGPQGGRRPVADRPGAPRPGLPAASVASIVLG